MSSEENVALPLLPSLSKAGVVDKAQVGTIFDDSVDRLNIRCNDSEQLAYTLSGGNQQKLILARWLAMDATLLLFEEPTRGVDIEGKLDLYRLIDRLKSEDKACVVASSDTEELVTICDRIAVLREGREAQIVETQGRTPANIMSELSATGVS